MCKFLASMSLYSPDIIGAPKRNPNLEMLLRPCAGDKTYYRVRLLNFNASNGSTRNDAHITRVVHTAWKLDQATGKKRPHRLVCSAYTPWVDVEGDKKSSCKVCAWQNQQWAIYNESGKTDKTAVANANSVKRVFEAIVPVYVVNDPNFEKNNGKMKVIIFNDKEEYKRLRSLIQHKLREVPVFNGKGAVDLLIHVATEDVPTSNGRIWKKTFIDQMVFSTKPRDYPAINEKTIDSFPFDDTYFVTPTKEDVDEFYNEFCALSNDDIPEADDIPVYDTPKTEAPKTTIPANTNAVDDDLPSDVDDIVDSASDDSLKSDPDEVGLEVEKTASANATQSVDDNEAKDILAELGF